MSEHLLSPENVLPFITSGKALFTLENSKTGNRFTYKVKKAEDKEIFFVAVLSGNDNTNDYSYIGTLFPDGFRHTKKSRVKVTATSFLAFNWLISRVKSHTLPETIHVWHHNKCGRCGRILTVPESIASGIGPECAKRL